MVRPRLCFSFPVSTQRLGSGGPAITLGKPHILSATIPSERLFGHEIPDRFPSRGDHDHPDVAAAGELCERDNGDLHTSWFSPPKSKQIICSPCCVDRIPCCVGRVCFVVFRFSFFLFFRFRLEEDILLLLFHSSHATIYPCGKTQIESIPASALE